MSSYSRVNKADIHLQNLAPAKIVKVPFVPSRRLASFELGRVWDKLAHDWWAWECVASAISIAATAGLVATLAVTDGDKQPEWGVGSARITLNAIVAAMATVIRTALTIVVGGALSQNAWNWYSSKRATEVLNAGKPLKDLDTFADAGSDPWASVMLIWCTRGRALATLGAVLTILSLGFDTFAQQVLTTRTRPVTELGSASLPRAMSYVGQADSNSTDLGVLNVPIPVEAALLSSLLADDTSVPASQCPTGECTWPPTPSLGVCSSCVDVTNQLWLNDLLLPDTIEHSINDTLRHTTLDISFVDWVTFAALQSVYPAYAENEPGGRLVIARTNVLGVPPSNYQPFLEVLSKVPKNTEFLPIPQDEVRPLIQAYTCDLSFCIQALEAKTTAGVISQTVNYTWEHFNLTKDGIWSPVKVPGSQNLSNRVDYRVENRSLNALGSAIATALVGGTSVWFSDITNPLPKILPLTNSDGGGSNVGTFAEVVWRASDSMTTITEYFDRVATGFTNFMRTAPSLSVPEDKHYAPVVFTNEVYVHVRWGWLAFPLLIVVLGQIFLGMTIHQTRRRRVQPWKGARVPLLLANIDDEVKKAAKGGLYSRSGLDEQVGEIKVRLEYNDGDEIAFKRI